MPARVKRSVAWRRTKSSTRLKTLAWKGAAARAFLPAWSGAWCRKTNPWTSVTCCVTPMKWNRVPIKTACWWNSCRTCWWKACWSPRSPWRRTAATSSCAANILKRHSICVAPLPKRPKRACLGKTFSAPALTSNCSCIPGQGATSAVKKPRWLTPSKVVVLTRVPSRHSRRAQAYGASRPASTTWKRCVTSRLFWRTASSGTRTSRRAKMRVPSWWASPAAWKTRACGSCRLARLRVKSLKTTLAACVMAWNLRPGSRAARALTSWPKRTLTCRWNSKVSVKRAAVWGRRWRWPSTTRLAWYRWCVTWKSSSPASRAAGVHRAATVCRGAWKFCAPLKRVKANRAISRRLSNCVDS